MAIKSSPGKFLTTQRRGTAEGGIKKMCLCLEKPKRVAVKCGEILKIAEDGVVTRSIFETDSFCWGYPSLFRSPYVRRNTYRPTSAFEQEYLTELKSVASSFGYSPDSIDEILRQGFTLDDVEEMLYCGHL